VVRSNFPLLLNSEIPPMRTALDSSILIQLYRKQAGWELWRDKLQAASAEGQLLISPVAFAEYSVAYPSSDSALADLDRLNVIYDMIAPDSAYLAGQIFLRYRREGGPRLHLLPDFLIAAHATMQAERLAAIDRGYLRRYFPDLELLSLS
jgi:predicted nucleic acid-binding protein